MSQFEQFVPWTEQPPMDTPVQPGVLAAVLPMPWVVDLASRRRVALQDIGVAARYVAGKYGWSKFASTSNGSRSTYPLGTWAASSDLMLLSVFETPNPGVTNDNARISNAPASFRLLEIITNASGNLVANARGSDAVVRSVVGPAVSAAVPLAAVASYEAGAGVSLAVDGTDYGTNAFTQNLSHAPGVLADAIGTNGRTYLAAWLDFNVWKGRQVELSQNPWIIFQPRRVWVPVSAGGGGATTLALADASHAHTVDSITLTTATTLAVADCVHGHTADALALAAQSLLAVADAVHAHTADTVTLGTTGAETLAVADASHAHTADALALSVQAALAVADATHAHTAQAVALAVQSVLAVADATHGHTAEAVVLGVAGATTLAVADATHAHAVDGLVLTTESLLAIQDALHAHTAESLVLSDTPALLIADALHAHTADGLALTVDAWLVVADALHAHTVDTINLSGAPLVVLVPSRRRVVHFPALRREVVYPSLRRTVDCYPED